MAAPRQFRAGQTVEDYCRQCHEDRIHTIIVVDGAAQPLRVTCDYCRSEHNYRGGPRTGQQAGRPAGQQGRTTGQQANRPAGQQETMAYTPQDSDLDATIRRIIREETGLTPVAPAERWRGGQLVLRPGKAGVQEKAMPIDTFFNKIVMLRNRLRTLEQHVNASDLPDDQKLKLQAYVTGCYGSLTSFNVLFAEEDDRFKGSGGGD